MGQGKYNKGRASRATLGICALALWLLAFASSAQAAPVHPHLAGLDLTGGPSDPGLIHPAEPFNHACGVAVDSEGDVYVASAGNDAIDVFTPSHEYLTTIANANEPCGLAVDSKGNLYVSEQALGKVVKYTPNEYPFVGTPVYGPPVTIDNSEEAKGISVDPFDDRLYVAKGSRIDAYDPDGSLGAIDEVQRVLVFAATGGFFKLSFDGEETGPIAFDAPHTDPGTPGIIDSVQEALEALSTIGPGNVSVSEGSPSWAGRDHIVVFQGALAGNDVELLEGDDSGLIGGSLIIEPKVNGFSGHTGEGDLTNATGVAAYTYEDQAAGNARYLFVAENATDTIEVFGGTSAGTLTLRQSIDGSDGDPFKADRTPDNGIGFGVTGPNLGVNRANGHVFVYDSEHEVVDEFEATGAYLTQIDHPDFEDAEPSAVAVFAALDEIQGLHTNASGGTFTLTFEGETTAPLSYSAEAIQIQGALEALSTVGEDNVLVQVGSSGASGLPNRAYVVTFTGGLGKKDVDQVECDGTGLTGGTGICTVTTKRDGSGPEERIYVTRGASTGAKALAFGPLAVPSRPPRDDLSFELKNACGVAVDSYGNRYVGADAKIHVYDQAGNEIKIGADGKGIEDAAGHPCDLAVDSAGTVYALDGDIGFVEGGRAVYFTPDSFPPTDGTKYSGPTIIAESSDFASSEPLRSIGVNPDNDHVFVTNPKKIIELDSAAKGSAILDPNFGSGLVKTGEIQGIDAYGANGNVYVSTGSGSGFVWVLDADGTELLARITGTGSPEGAFGFTAGSLGVDQSNGHALLFEEGRGAIEEYEASGAFVAEFGSFVNVPGPSDIAIDNSGSSNDRNAYLAYFGELTAFDPLVYGEPPNSATGMAENVGGGNATLNGTVDPRRFDLTECKFEYLTDAEYQVNLEAEDPPFKDAAQTPCVPGLAEIGKGSEPVSVHAAISGLDPEGRYRFRLVAENKYGVSEGEAGIFGPPTIAPKSTLPIAFGEATVRATIDPSGLASKHWVEYGTSEAYGQSTATVELGPEGGTSDIAVPLFGLTEGTTYHFRFVAENEAKTVFEPDQSFETRERPGVMPCPNTEYRIGRSATLPDCRAYELVTPADTRGLPPYATLAGDHMFNNWLTAPQGAAAGDILSFFTDGTLPGFNGSGWRDGYRARRTAGGWKNELFGPSYLEAGGTLPAQQGISSEQEYSYWTLTPNETFAGTLAAGNYLRTPAGFELIGQGSVEGATDPDAEGWFLSGPRAIFSSKAHLEEDAAPTPTESIYERMAGSPSAKVVSLRPGDTPFGPGEGASYVGATEDGSAILFKVGGTLYVRREGQTVEVTSTPNTFAGVSTNGARIFYVDAVVGFGSNPPPTGLFSFDSDTQVATKIAAESRFINVSADGSRVYFTSTEVLDDAEEATLGAHNLYLWDEVSETIRFIVLLDPQDLALLGFEGSRANLLRWLAATAQRQVDTGRGLSPTRSTPGGEALVFQSHGNLTPYDAEGHSEIYRYDAAANGGEGELSCVSCNPTGAPPNGDATLQTLRSGGPTDVTTVIPNITDDGGTVFFESVDALLPEDANSVQDVYEWKDQGAGACDRAGGCLALISSGQGENDNYLYSMTPDGHDVFFRTMEKLVGADIAGSPSIYDARVDGGIPDPVTPAPCQGDACQGAGGSTPALPTAASTGPGNGDVQKVTPRPRCAKGKRKIRRNGRTRCVKKIRKGTRHHTRTPNRSNDDRGAAR